ncbi:ABC transporter substrate binding protein [Psychromonas sp.]|uniref:ABC transporter substrate binding protein n=1 Tax=Psychromonas sp. TaxID=1884585 RepID=UPI0039E4564E
MVPVCYGEKSGEEQTILVLNSYHKGYEWSDQIISGIESTLSLPFPKANIHIEYMDTKRNSSPAYFNKLLTLYLEKFKERQFDLIIATDDHAIDFLLRSGETLFPGIPVVFCGANALDIKKFQKKSDFTGVLEFADIKATLDIALHLQPNTRKIVVINDQTATGRYVAEEFDKVLPTLNKDLKIEILEDQPLTELADSIKQLSPDTIILLLAYLRDGQGVYYDPELTASLLSAASSVPIYSIWDFYFNYGITGGVLTSGFRQGETVAEMATKILMGAAPSDIEIVTRGVNRLLFDYKQIKHFNLPIEKLPQDAIVKNITYADQKNILILHSYSADNPWTKAIMNGLENILHDSEFMINSFTEFMDSKRFTDKAYLYSLTQLLKLKYGQQDLDLIIVSDDNAFNFMMRLKDHFFKNIPVVFCGVNYLQDPQNMTSRNITGVMESYDILGTLKMGLSLFPKTETIYVINDTTTTGIANHQRFDEVVAKLPKTINIKHSGSLSMQQLQQKVAELDNKTVILLMSFNIDKNNHRFSYQESAQLISSHSVRPLFGFWDFYLDHGILGGVITRGWDQGKTAGILAQRVLNGEKVSSIPIVEKSPVASVIDFTRALSFDLNIESLPAGVTILNKPESFFDKYRNTIYITLWVLGIIVLIMGIKITLQTKKQKELSVKTKTDPMTGVNNLDHFNNSVNEIITSAIATNELFTLCYLDLDNLKMINDTFGHKNGDKYILLAVDSIRSQIRGGDLFCRVGGDEFIAILKHCTSSQGTALFKRAEKELHLQLKQHGLSLHTGISCGCCEFDPMKPVSVTILLETADNMMYKNKQKRKKCTPK